MKVKLNKNADVLYITFENIPAIAEEVADGVFVRTTAKNEIVGITILDFNDKLTKISKLIGKIERLTNE